MVARNDTMSIGTIPMFGGNAQFRGTTTTIPSDGNAPSSTRKTGEYSLTVPVNTNGVSTWSDALKQKESNNRIKMELMRTNKAPDQNLVASVKYEYIGDSGDQYKVSYDRYGNVIGCEKVVRAVDRVHARTGNDSWKQMTDSIINRFGIN